MAVAKLVNNHPNLAMVAEYSNAIEAKNGIKNNEIDLIFLDVEMPIITGFDLLEWNRPNISRRWNADYHWIWPTRVPR